MKKRVLFLFFGLISSVVTLSQSCLPDGISFWSQEEIDNFQTNYPNCTEIEGDVKIDGWDNDFNDLVGLNIITSIGGDLKIWNHEPLNDLIGLENLTSIGGSLDIAANVKLKNLDGLINLTSVGHNLEISGNKYLTTLSGLKNLEYIGNNIEVSHCYSLTSFDHGLEKITTVDGDLLIGNYNDENRLLVDISSLSNITSIKGELIIAENLSLANLEGLNNVNSIGGAIGISNNPSLTHITSLSNVNSMGGSLIINYNNALTSLDGLINIDSIPGWVTIYYNNSLEDLSGLDNVKYIQYDLNILGNDNLTTLTGLNGLTNANYHFLTIIKNNSLISLAGLENLTTVEGLLNIDSNLVLNNISALSAVTSIKDLVIRGNSSLENLVGLENIESVENDLHICGNESLTSLTGLDNLQWVGGYLIIGENSMFGYGGNASLNDLTALSNLKYVNEAMEIQENESLEDLTGFEKLYSVARALRINDNPSLISLSGIDNITNCDRVDIEANESLTDISSIGQISTQSGVSLSIRNNSSLSHCNNVFVCDYVENHPNASIYNNAPGCDTKEEVIESCNNSSPSCLPDGITFNDQESIDNFPSNFPQCNKILGDVTITNKEITNLEGLSNITSIDGDLRLYGNDQLNSLSGLDNLTNIGGALIIGLGDDCYDFGNTSLSSITSLDNLVSVGGRLQIAANCSLSGLTGLQNLSANSIEQLIISHNPNLSFCDVESICNYLITPTGSISIYYNAAGCNNDSEILSACHDWVEDIVSVPQFSIYPNPAINEIEILSQKDIIIDVITIYSTDGKNVMTKMNPLGKIDVSKLTRGIYFVEITSDAYKIRKKLIVA